MNIDKATMTLQKPIFTTSWDDGHPLDLRLADLLAKYDLPATFYIPRKSEWGTMSLTEVRSLSETYEIGGHTLSHTVLTGVADEQALQEIQGSKFWLEDVTGKKCQAFCFPSGKYSSKHIDHVTNSGYILARTAELMSLSQPHWEHGILMMPTTVQCFPHTPTTLIRNLLKRKAWYSLSVLVRVYQREWLCMLDGLLRLAFNTRGVFHLWGHSWEIESNGIWSHLEKALELMSQYRHYVIYTHNSGVCDV